MLGCGITSIGLGVIVVAILAGSSASTLPWWLVVAVSLIGFGNGMILPTLTGLSLSEVAPKQAGMASGVVTTLQQFGASLGVVIVGAIFYSFATKSTINGMTASTIIHISCSSRWSDSRAGGPRSSRRRPHVEMKCE